MEIIRLACFTCRDLRVVEVVNKPQFAFEFGAIAQEIGMKAHFDHRRARVLVFCDDECAKAALTKSGHFRKNMPTAAQRDAMIQEAGK